MELKNYHSNILTEVVESLQFSAGTTFSEEDRYLDLPLWKIPTFCEPSWFLDPESNRSRAKGLLALQRKDIEFRQTTDWNDPRIVEWASKKESALMLLEGSYATRDALESCAVDLIDYLEGQGQEVVWMLNSVRRQQDIIWDGTAILKQVACQLLRKSASFRTLEVLADLTEMFKTASTMDNWFQIIAAALEDNKLVYIVLNLGLLGTKTIDTAQWPALFAKLFGEAEQRLGSILKVVLLSPRGFPNPDVSLDAAVVKINSRFNSTERPVSGKASESLIKLPILRKPDKAAIKRSHVEAVEVPHSVSIAKETLKMEPCKRQVTNVNWFRDSQLMTCRDQNREGWFYQMKLFEKCVDASRKDPGKQSLRVKIG